jgi:hypothetical protein
LAETVNAEDFADFVRAVTEAPNVVPLPAGGQLALTGPD